MKPTLFVLAAGMGSRYGGLKQLDGLGPHGETITFSAKVKNATGIHDLYICFDKTQGDVRLDWWQFKK